MRWCYCLEVGMPCNAFSVCAEDVRITWLMLVCKLLCGIPVLLSVMAWEGAITTQQPARLSLSA